MIGYRNQHFYVNMKNVARAIYNTIYIKLSCYCIPYIRCLKRTSCNSVYYNVPWLSA